MLCNHADLLAALSRGELVDGNIEKLISRRPVFENAYFTRNNRVASGFNAPTLEQRQAMYAGETREAVQTPLPKPSVKHVPEVYEAEKCVVFTPAQVVTSVQLKVKEIEVAEVLAPVLSEPYKVDYLYTTAGYVHTATYETVARVEPQQASVFPVTDVCSPKYLELTRTLLAKIDKTFAVILDGFEDRNVFVFPAITPGYRDKTFAMTPNRELRYRYLFPKNTIKIGKFKESQYFPPKLKRFRLRVPTLDVTGAFNNALWFENIGQVGCGYPLVTWCRGALCFVTDGFKCFVAPLEGCRNEFVASCTYDGNTLHPMTPYVYDNIQIPAGLEAAHAFRLSTHSKPWHVYAFYSTGRMKDLLVPVANCHSFAVRGKDVPILFHNLWKHGLDIDMRHDLAPDKSYLFNVHYSREELVARKVCEIPFEPFDGFKLFDAFMSHNLHELPPFFIERDMSMMLTKQRICPDNTWREPRFTDCDLDFDLSHDLLNDGI